MVEVIIPINALAPPFAPMNTGSESEERILITRDPGGETVIVFAQGEPLISTGGEDIVCLVNVDGAVSTIDFFRDDDVTIPTGNLGEGNEWNGRNAIHCLITWSPSLK